MVLRVVSLSDTPNVAAVRALKVATAEQMREFDRRTAEEFGVPSLVLMENAGRHVAETAARMLGSPHERRVVIVAGSGNNGGDGFVAARHLHDAGAVVSVFLLADPGRVKGDAKVNLDILLDRGFSVQQVNDASQLADALSDADLVVDAIFGTGLHGDVSGLIRDVISAMNAAQTPVLAVDIPSGVDADSGKIWGVAVRADCTVTFALPKIGLLVYPGASCVGELTVADIGIPDQLFDEVMVEMPTREWVAARLPHRPPDAHKGTFGTTLVIAGSPGLTGAAAMAAESALRAGCGLSTLAVSAGLQDLMATKLTEVMTRGLPETEDRAISSDAVRDALALSERATAVVLGCGLGTHPETAKFVRRFVKSATKPIIIDADGLNAFAGDTRVLEEQHTDLILTPHPGEMSRLIGTAASEVQSNRIETARSAAARFRSVVVLKGARTLIAEPGGRVYINTTGNPGMATGGTGDVLAGIIGGLLAQGMSASGAAVCGVYVHGLAGDIAAESVGAAGMIAGDVIRAIPYALKQLYEMRTLKRGYDSCDSLSP